MNNALNSFNNLIAQAHNSAGLFYHLQQKRICIDASDLLRWEWVLSVSAFDKYIHDIVRIGMVEIFLGRRPETEKYKTFHMTMPVFSEIKNSATPNLAFEREIIKQHKFSAFQAPEKVADALSYIWAEKHKWQVISSNMITPISESDLRTKLNNIVLRRNQIVHEGDCIPSVIPQQQQVITDADAQDVIEFISDLVNSIHVSVI